MLSFFGWHWPRQYKIHTAHKVGVVNHMKSEVDGIFGEADSRVREAAKSETLSDVPDVARVLRGDGDHARPEHVFELLPDIPRKQWVQDHPLIDPGSLPLPIRSSHAFYFRRRDARQQSLLGHDGISITGIRAMTSVLPGLPSDASFTVQLRKSVDPLPEPADEEEAHADVPDDDEAHAAVPALSYSSTDHLGWRTTYRKVEPDKPNYEKIVSKLKWTTKAFEGVLLKNPKARRVYRAVYDHKKTERTKQRAKQLTVEMRARRREKVFTPLVPAELPPIRHGYVQIGGSSGSGG